MSIKYIFKQYLYKTYKLYNNHFIKKTYTESYKLPMSKSVTGYTNYSLF